MCELSYSTISLEGGLFTPDLLEGISQADSNIPGQNASDFGLRPNRSLLDEIQSSFSDASLRWDAFNRRRERSRQNLTTLTRQDWAAPLFEILGFPPLELQRGSIELGGTTFPISHLAYSAEHAPPVHIVAPDQCLDQRGHNTRRSPHALVQEYLNHSESLWGLVTNGAKLRLLRDSARLSKPTYLEFDLKAMLEGNAYGEFTALYRLIHATRFPHPGAEPHECLLESYYNQGIEEGGRVREKLRDGVKSALEILGAALIHHPTNDALRDAFRSGRLSENAYYRQLLSFVYRLLFLMVAEERKVLFNNGNDAGLQTIYQRYYSVTSLRQRAERRFAGDTHGDLWQGLAQTFRLFRDPMAADAMNLFPMNGELFKESTCRDLETAFCPNEAFLDALRNLSTFRDGDVTRRVNYAHLDVEEFGSVYESLLDYRPVVLTENEETDRRHGFRLAAGTERKQTGSYYTPPELVRELVDSALVPVVEAKLQAAKTPDAKEQALLSLRVCDPAAGSGHFLLAAARRIARELARVRSGEEEPAPAEYRTALRDVVRNCIYAVDKNPLAVDLCKVALWIESHAAGFPLSFLDHHIKYGDSLVGVRDIAVLEAGIPDDVYKAVTGDDKKAATQYRNRNRLERKGQTALPTLQKAADAMATEWAAFADLEERSPDEVKAKEDLYQVLRSSDTLWWQQKVACDLWTYAYFAPLQPQTSGRSDTVPTTDNVRQALANRSTKPQLEATAIGVSLTNAFFHWPLEFPDVFENNGGFDVVLGNPPWDQVQLDPGEFFATRDHSITAQPNMAARNRAIEQLATSNRPLYEEYQAALRSMNGIQKFLHSSDRFPKSNFGRLNSAPLFAEHCLHLLSPIGRAGIIVPTSIATDSFNQYFFADLVNRQSLVSLYDFENRERVFPGIDSRIKFCLLTLTGADSPSSQAEFAFFLHRAEQLQDTERHFTLAPTDFALFNPNTRTCPIFRTRKDADLAAKMYHRAGVLWREARDDEPEDNPWRIRFQLMFMMNTASHLFRTREQLTTAGWRLEGNVFVKEDERYLPLYEAKLFHQYDHRFATFDDAGDRALRGGNARNMATDEKADPDVVVIPRYWVLEEEVNKQIVEPGADGVSAPRNSAPKHRTLGNSIRDWHLTFRDIASPTNQRTSISAVIPGVAAGNNAPLINVEYAGWFHGFHETSDDAEERKMLADNLKPNEISNSALTITYERSKSVASTLLLANLNSLPLDWAVRLSVGNNHMNFYIVKQLPVLPPEVYLDTAPTGDTWAELIVPRALELTYTAWDLQPFAQNLGYDGPPFVWDEERRHRLKCELDAIYAQMYQLSQEGLGWILDAPDPSQSFPGLKQNEEEQFGEYRTQRYVLQAYDQLARGELPNLDN